MASISEDPPPLSNNGLEGPGSRPNPVSPQICDLGSVIQLTRASISDLQNFVIVVTLFLPHSTAG